MLLNTFCCSVSDKPRGMYKLKLRSFGGDYLFFIKKPSGNLVCLHCQTMSWPFLLSCLSILFNYHIQWCLHTHTHAHTYFKISFFCRQNTGIPILLLQYTELSYSCCVCLCFLKKWWNSTWQYVFVFTDVSIIRIPCSMPAAY